MASSAMAVESQEVSTPESDIFSVCCSSLSLDSEAFHIIPKHMELCAPMPSVNLGCDDFHTICETPSYDPDEYLSEDSFEYDDNEATPSADGINLAYTESMSLESTDSKHDYESQSLSASLSPTITEDISIKDNTCISTATDDMDTSSDKDAEPVKVTTVKNISVPTVTNIINTINTISMKPEKHVCSIADLSNSFRDELIAMQPKCKVKYDSNKLLEWFTPSHGNKTYIKITFHSKIYHIYLWLNSDDGKCIEQVTYAMANNYRKNDKYPGKKLLKAALAFSKSIK